MFYFPAQLVQEATRHLCPPSPEVPEKERTFLHRNTCGVVKFNESIRSRYQVNFHVLAGDDIRTFVSNSDS